MLINWSLRNFSKTISGSSPDLNLLNHAKKESKYLVRPSLLMPSLNALMLSLKCPLNILLIS
jgi:hypothetical protein